MPAGSRFIGSRDAASKIVSVLDDEHFRPTVPRPFRIGFILSCPPSSSEFLLRLSRSTRPVRHSRAVPSLVTDPARISSLIATSPVASTILSRGTRGFQAPLRSVLGFSQPLDGFLRHRFRGLVSSRCHVQGFAPYRGFSRLAADHRLVAAVYLRAVRTRALTGKPAATHAPVDFEAFLHESMRSVNQVV